MKSRHEPITSLQVQQQVSSIPPTCKTVTVSSIGCSFRGCSCSRLSSYKWPLNASWPSRPQTNTWTSRSASWSTSPSFQNSVRWQWRRSCKLTASLVKSVYMELLRTFCCAFFMLNLISLIPYKNLMHYSCNLHLFCLAVRDIRY